MDKMSLIVFAATGHVLGAFTRQGDPEGVLDPAAVAGEGVWIRDEETGARLLTVEPAHLAVEVLDRNDRVLLDWQRYLVADGTPDEPLTSPTVALTLANLTLTVPGVPASEPIEAWVQVEGGPSGERIVRKVIIPANLNNAVEPIPLAAGHYEVLALVPGFRSHLDRFDLP